MTSEKRATVPDIWSVSMRGSGLRREQDVLVLLGLLKPRLRHPETHEDMRFYSVARRILLVHIAPVQRRDADPTNPLPYFTKVRGLLSLAGLDVPTAEPRGTELEEIWSKAAVIANAATEDLASFLQNDEVTGARALVASCGVLCLHHMSDAMTLQFLREYKDVDDLIEQFVLALHVKEKALNEAINFLSQG